MPIETDPIWQKPVTVVEGRRYLCICCGASEEQWLPSTLHPSDRDWVAPEGWEEHYGLMFCPEHAIVAREYTAERDAYSKRARAAFSAANALLRVQEREWRAKNPAPTPPWEVPDAYL